MMLLRRTTVQPTATSSKAKSSSKKTQKGRFGKKKNGSSEQQQHRFESIGGVFYLSNVEDDSISISNIDHMRSQKSLSDSSKTYRTEETNSDTASTTSQREEDDRCSPLHGSSSKSTTVPKKAWHSSGERRHHIGAPILVKSESARRRLDPNGSKNRRSGDATARTQLSDEEILGRIMLRTRNLPKYNTYLTSNHVMINYERKKRHVAPLTRMPSMDELARRQARRMAGEHRLFHSDPNEILQARMGGKTKQNDADDADESSNVNSDEYQRRRIGENVTCGANLEEIHNSMMKDSPADKNNIIDRRFSCMGVGTAMAVDGTLYLCQIFRE